LWRSAPDYVLGGDRQASWRQQRTAQTKRTPLSVEQRRRSNSSVLGAASLSKIPQSDLPRRCPLHHTNSTANQDFNTFVQEEEEQLDPRIAKDVPDLAGALLETLQQCADHSTSGQLIRRNVIKNTVYAGGTTMHPGFQKRAVYEMQSVAGDDAKHLTFWSTEQPLYAAYRGASLLANSSFRDSAAMISKAEYEEKGCGMIVDKWAF
jgi:actin-related protein